MCVRSMKCNELLTRLLPTLCLVLLLTVPLGAQAAGNEAPPAEETVEAGQTEPLVTPLMGGAGLVLLIAMGAVTSRKQREQEDAGYDRVWPDGERIEDPYRRLAGRKRK